MSITYCFRKFYIFALNFLNFYLAKTHPLDNFDPLNLHDDGTSKTTDQRVESTHKHSGILLFNTHYEHVSAPLTIALWFLIVTVVKIVFHRFRSVHNLFPDSALLIVLGLIFGYIFSIIYPDEVYLKPDWFFLYLLPPIVLDAGYFLPNGDFFRNIGTILTYAVIGTLYNTFSIGGTLILLSKYFKVKSTPMELLLFSTLISAVDPVAVLCVFEEIHVNQLLYICVFGESLLNDAVTIVLYQTFSVMVEVDNLSTVDYCKAGASFFIVSFGGILIGIAWALITGFTTKYARHLNVVQPLICLLFPYLAYLTSEMVSMSGILAIMICGVVMKQFLVGNLSRKSLVTVQYFMKTLSSSCEALIFVYLGISAVSKNHDWDLLFISVTILSCLLQRFIGVFALTWLLNTKRIHKIDVVDQFIMSYGGLRGAVCYGLVMSINREIVNAKNMFASCTISVILFTVFIQGTTIKWLVKLLKVKNMNIHKKTLFEMVGENLLNEAMAGIEAITGHRGHYRFRSMFVKWKELYLQPFLMFDQKTKAEMLVDYNEHIQVKEAIEHLKQHGSFLGLPSLGSRTGLAQSETLASNAGNLPDNMYKRTGRPKDIHLSLPRKESISTFIRNRLNSCASPINHGMYSRHLLGIDMPRNYNLRSNNELSNFDALENEAYHMTYPYCKPANKRRKTYGEMNEAKQKKNTLALPENSGTTSRFIVISSANDENRINPPNTLREHRSKSIDDELQEGLLMKIPSGSHNEEKNCTLDVKNVETSIQKKPILKLTIRGPLNDEESLLPVIKNDEHLESSKRIKFA